VYIVDVSTTVTISPKTQLTKPERTSKYLILAWAVSFLVWLSLSITGALLPNADLGREFLLWSGIPGFVAQLIGARFLVKSYRKRQAEHETTQAILNAQERAREEGAGLDNKPQSLPTAASSP
jgi:Na+/proline symporter